MFERPRSGERAVLVRLGLGEPLRAADLEEFQQLARSAGATPVATVTGRRERPDSRYFVGSGKAEEIGAVAAAESADVILIDHPLSPSQERNLEKLTGRRVLDRNGLILDIFAQRARSFEGKLQVELAQLKHLSTRLVRGWTHLERQKGGIGLRGPGETQLETDRRLLATRVRSLTRKLARLRQQRDTGRSARAEIPVPGVALVGYTNAGKSTLFRALTGADAYVADQLFATLDPTVRRLTLPGGAGIVVADTVGFIRELPHELVAAFQSTLQEARSAQLLVHLIDAADLRRDEYAEQVNAVLAEIGAGELPQLLVYNKIDRLELEPRIERDAAGAVRQVWISAAQSRGIELLKEAITERLELRAQRGWLQLPAAAGALRARLFAGGAVREERTDEDGAMRLLIELPPEAMAAIARNPGVQLTLLPAGLPCAHA
ncbi:MAG TPA: ribosome rescue GTPase HflX [Steroidobacteraceae bacterium]|nr:ribosome rescue GTPase HflX [Steroidobacteraceae bacterium]